jgi:hypothetical protein
MSSGSCRLDGFLRALTVIANVFFDSAHEEGWLLADEAELLPQAIEIELLNAAVVKEDVPLCGLVEAKEQLDDC